MLFVSLSLTLMISPTNLFAGDSDRIKGVADFLIDRANDNYLLILETRMKENKAFKMYLPVTYDQILNLDLKRVLQSSPAVWEKSIDADLATLQKKKKKHLRQDISVYVSKGETAYYDMFLERAGNVKIQVDGKEYPITVVALNAPQKVKESVSKIYDSYINIQSKLNDIFKGLVKVKAGKIEATTLDALMSDALTAIYEWETILNSKEFTLANTNQLLKISDDIKVCLIKSRDINRYVENMSKPDLPLTMKVNNTLLVIEYLVDKHGKALFDNSNDYEVHKEYYSQFKQYALFFAQISNAKSSDEVKEILKAYTLPSVSFGVKRKPRENHFSISSYLGVAAGAETTYQNTVDKNINYYVGLIAPVGMEYSWGLKSKSSISLFAGVFDFGAAVNAQLYGSSETIDRKSVV